MLVKRIRVSAKGRITLPAEALRALNAGKGTQFVLIQDGARMVLVRADAVGRPVLDGLGGWDRLAEPAFAQLWDNQEDAGWN